MRPPIDLETLRTERARAERQGDDHQLLRLRELELDHESLPELIDGVRRTRLLGADPLATTWEGWHVDGGHRVLLRCARIRWRRDPVMLRRLGRDAHRLESVQWRTGGDWPHLVTGSMGAPLFDRLPAEDGADTPQLARILAAGLAGLERIHATGRAHGGPIDTHLVQTETGFELLWLDSFCPGRPQSADLCELAALVAALDPSGDDPVAQLARGWESEPPLSAADGLALLRRNLGALLLDARHGLAVSARNHGRRSRIASLARCVRQLATLLPPPAGHVCLRAGSDRVDVIAHSDGVRVTGGAAADANQPLACVYSPERGLDAQASRVLLRAWAMRARGDEERRTAVQARLGGTDEQAGQLVRWLSSMARLRAARLLLGAEAS